MEGNQGIVRVRRCKTFRGPAAESDPCCRVEQARHFRAYLELASVGGHARHLPAPCPGLALIRSIGEGTARQPREGQARAAKKHDREAARPRAHGMKDSRPRIMRWGSVRP